MGREEWETMPDKNNVLIVGNGIDRLAGYNTDYLSFLKANLSHYTKIIDAHIDKKIENLKYEDFYTHNEVELPNKELKQSALTKKRFVDTNKNPSEPRIFKNKSNNQNVETYQLDSYFDKYTIINQEYMNEKKSVQKVNTWIAYFIAHHVKLKKTRGYWVDLERLIFLNESKNSQLSFKYIDFLKEYTNITDEEMFNQKHEDFLEMKKLLVNYLRSEKERVLEEQTAINYAPLRKYGTILNFNYSSTYFMNPNLRSRQRTISPYEIDEIHIHGEFEDESNIVFGFDDGMVLNRQTKEYELVSGNSKKYSKTHQLLTLATSINRRYEEIQKLPSKSDISEIGVLGHSIGQADYNYFETLCNFDNVRLEVFWYSFEFEGETGNIVKKNNKQESIDAVINMIHEMEKRKGKTLLHRMLIEQRIVFQELTYERKPSENLNVGMNIRYMK